MGLDRRPRLRHVLDLRSERDQDRALFDLPPCQKMPDSQPKESCAFYLFIRAHQT